MITNLLRRGADDWVDVAEVMWVVKSVGGTDGDQAIRKESVDTIRKVLEAGWFVAGEVIRDRGFEPWQLHPTEAVSEVNRRWDALGREPGLGEVCWLQITEAGEEELRRRHVER